MSCGRQRPCFPFATAVTVTAAVIWAACPGCYTFSDAWESVLQVSPSPLIAVARALELNRYTQDKDCGAKLHFAQGYAEMAAQLLVGQGEIGFGVVFHNTL